MNITDKKISFPEEGTYKDALPLPSWRRFTNNPI
jgi:hypothetical protein